MKTKVLNKFMQECEILEPGVEPTAEEFITYYYSPILQKMYENKVAEVLHEQRLFQVVEVVEQNHIAEIDATDVVKDFEFDETIIEIVNMNHRIKRELGII